MMALLGGKGVKGPRPFAPPFLRDGDLVVAHTANVLAYLAPRLGLVPKDERSRLHAHQLQLSVTDFYAEAHDTHHPIAGSLYYEDQKEEAKRRAEDFVRNRIPKFLRYFEDAIAKKTATALGATHGYVDLSLFQVVEGLRYAFPSAMKKLEPKHPKLVALHDRVAARPRIRAYLESQRRIPFNESGIFRRYPELDFTP
jgi:glutathione S-transferase